MIQLLRNCRKSFMFFAVAYAFLIPMLVAEPLSTRVSSLVARPESFDGKVIKVKAYVRTDGRHLTVLFDHVHSDQGVALLMPSNSRRDASVIELMRHVYVSPREFMSHRIRGTFTGTFTWRPGSVPSRVLSLARVENIEIMNNGK